MNTGQESIEHGDRNDEDSVVKELTLEERYWNGDDGLDELVTPMIVGEA